MNISDISTARRHILRFIQITDTTGIRQQACICIHILSWVFLILTKPPKPDCCCLPVRMSSFHISFRMCKSGKPTLAEKTSEWSKSVTVIVQKYTIYPSCKPVIVFSCLKQGLQLESWPWSPLKLVISCNSSFSSGSGWSMLNLVCTACWSLLERVSSASWWSLLELARTYCFSLLNLKSNA